MKQLFIIILDPNVDSSLLRAKIQELGDYYNIYYNQYVLLAEFDSAQQLYDKLVPPGTPQTGIVIFCTPVSSLKYWGYSDKGLWSWLSEHV